MQSTLKEGKEGRSERVSPGTRGCIKQTSTYEYQMEYQMVEIKKLPPGEAIGARDLQQWASRRSAGQYGAEPDRTAACRLCGKYFERRHSMSKTRTCPACRKLRKQARRKRIMVQRFDPPGSSKP